MNHPTLRKIETREVLFDIVQAGFETKSLDEYFRLTQTLIGKVIDADSCALLLRNRLTGQLGVEYSFGPVAFETNSFEALKQFADYLLRGGKSIAHRKIASGGAEFLEGTDADWSSLVGIPLKTSVRSIGVLTLSSFRKEILLEEAELEFVSRAAEQIALVVERRQAEESLRESEGRYRMLFDHAPDGIVISDAEGKLLDANGVFCASLGYTYNEFIQLSAAEIVASSELQQIPVALKEIANEAEHHREWRLLRKDGSEFSADVSSKVMPDGNILAMVRDLSERRKAEIEKAVLAAEVEVQRERLRNILARVPGVVWETIVDKETQKQVGNFVSDYLTVMLGYTVGEWLATPDFWSSIVDPNFPRQAEANASFALADGGLREIPLLSRQGRVVWVEAHTTPITGSRGKIEGMRGVMLDITDRKRSEHALRESEERYRELVENALDIIYVHDLEGNYISINHVAEKITGYSRDEILHMNLAKSVAPEHLQKAREMMSAKLEGKEVTAYEIEIIGKDGRRIVLEVNSRLVYDNGVPVAIQGIARDTTERHLLEEKYRQSQKLEAIGLLAGGISHDFNNLLIAITGYSEITLAKMPADDPLRHYVEEIKATGERASALTHQLLAFSRKQVLKPVVHNLNSVLRNVDKMLRRLLRENIDFNLHLCPELANVEADPGQLEQVIVNLAINAQDAMPGGGRLTISTENVRFDEGDNKKSVKLGQGLFVKMTVSDNGDGIDEQIHERIFEPFFTTKESGRGSGLGLSTVHGIVKQSGGEILVESSKGRGTTFEIYLPAAADGHEIPEWTSAGPESFAGNETVLLVEDDRSVRKLVREVLAAAGYEVLEAESGEAAIEICQDRRQPINMLLTDLVMPQMSGIELTTRVREMHPEAKTLVMTGYASDSPIRGSMTDFKASFIEKPFTPESLARKVREVLDS